jgi:hypothetical protein
MNASLEFPVDKAKAVDFWYNSKGWDVVLRKGGMKKRTENT